jgi:hypothetical protein
MPAPYPNQKILDTIWIIVCQTSGKVAASVKATRKQEEVVLRHVFWAIARKETAASLKQLAMYSGVENHTSVLHGTRRVRKALGLTPRGNYVEPMVANLYLKALAEFQMVDAKDQISRPSYEQTEIERNINWLIAP